MQGLGFGAVTGANIEEIMFHHGPFSEQGFFVNYCVWRPAELLVLFSYSPCTIIV